METDNPILLHIETATDICSVAITQGEQVLSVRESHDGNSHSKNLLPFIDEVLKACTKTLSDLQGIVVSIGPGSYTGLRIGVSTAKGMAYSLQIPIIAINTLESIAYGCREQNSNVQADIIPMIDARRMEVFACRYQANMQIADEVSAVIVTEETFASLLKERPIIFCGNGMPKCKELLSKYANAQFAEFPLSAQYMRIPAIQKWQVKDFEDIAYFEPFYLKEYVAAKPNVKGLR